MNKLLSGLRTKLFYSTSQEFLDLESRLFTTRMQTISESMSAEMENPLLSQEYLINSKQAGEQIVDHSRLLAAEKVKNQKEILRHYNWDEDIQEIEHKKGQRIDRQAEEEAYQSDVFYLEEIKQICMDFNMKFRPANELVFFDQNQKYEITPVIEEFCRQLKYDNGGKDYDRFYALAIAEDFASKEERKAGKKAKSKTPRLMMFYLTDKKKKTFIHVNTWGSTKFPVTRYVQAWAVRNPINAFVGRTVLFSSILFVLGCLFTSSPLFGIWAGAVGVGAVISAITVLLQLQRSAESRKNYGKSDYVFINESWNTSV